MISKQQPVPFVGPRPFELDDEQRFFGRDREVGQLLSLVGAHAAVLLYAASGAGKTSLINAGLLPRLRQEGYDVLIGRVRGTAAGTSVAPANFYVYNALVSWDSARQAAEDTTAPEPQKRGARKAPLSRMSLGAYLRDRRVGSAGNPSRPCVLIFDQFEELFTFSPERWADRQGFFEQVRDALEGTPLAITLSTILDPDDLAARLRRNKDPASMALRARLPGDVIRLLDNSYQLFGGPLSRMRDRLLENPDLAVDGSDKASRDLLLGLVLHLNRAMQGRPLAADGFPPPPELSIASASRAGDGAYVNRRALEAAFPGLIAPVVDGDPMLRALFAMREDYVTQLDPYCKILPENLRTRLRLEPLRAPAALLAVTGPLGVTDRSFDAGAAEELVARLMKTPGTTDDAGRVIEATEEFVDPVQLQIVCDTLWKQLPDGVKTISKRYVSEKADISGALLAFYDRCVAEAAAVGKASEGEIRRWFQDKLITSLDTRRPVIQDQKRQDTEGLHNEVVQKLDELHLIKLEIRGTQPWYELSHDRFITPVQKSNRIWFSEQAAKAPTLSLLEVKAARYARPGSPQDLLTGNALSEASRWLRSPEATKAGVSDKVRAFILASQAAAQRKQKYLWGGLVTAALFVVVGFTVQFRLFSVREQRAKDQAREKADDENLEKWGKVSADLARQPGQEFQAVVLGLRAVPADRARDKNRPPPAAAVDGLKVALGAVGDATWMRGPTGSVRQIEFSPDGSLVLTRTDEEFCVWNAATGEFRYRVPVAVTGTVGDNKSTTRAATQAVQASGALQDVDGSGTGNAGQADTPRWLYAHFVHGGHWIVAMRSSPRATGIGVGQTSEPANVARPGTEIWSFYSPSDGRPCDPLRTLPPEQTFEGMSRDGSRIVTKDRDGILRVWDEEVGGPCATLATPLPDSRALYVSPDYSRAVTVGVGSVDLWNLRQRGAHVATIDTHRVWSIMLFVFPRIGEIRFSHDSRFFILFDRLYATPRAVGQTRPDTLPSLTVPSPEPGTGVGRNNQEMIAAGDSPTGLPPTVFESQRGDRLATFTGVESDRFYITQGDRSIVAPSGRGFQIWSAVSWEAQGRWFPAPIGFRSSGLAISPDGQFLLFRNESVCSKVAIWDAATGRVTAQLEGPLEFTSNGPSVLSTDNSRLAIGNSSVVCVWDLTRPQWSLAGKSATELRDRACELLKYQPECKDAQEGCNCSRTYNQFSPEASQLATRPFVRITTQPAAGKDDVHGAAGRITTKDGDFASPNSSSSPKEKSTMFGLPILDVAIGLAFVYLLLSLICSVINEWIASVMARRSKNLLFGVRNLLACGPLKDATGEPVVLPVSLVGANHQDASGRFVTLPVNSGGRQFMNANGDLILYDSLKRAILAPVTVTHSFTDAAGNTVVLPAKDALDKVVRRNVVKDANGQVAPLPLFDARGGIVYDSDGNDVPQTGIHADAFFGHPLIQGLCHGETVPSYIPARSFALTLFDLLVPPDGQSPPAFADIRTAVMGLPETLRRQILPAVDDADGNLKKARDNVENWYNESMDRLTGVYKRNSTLINVALAFIMAVSLNADTFSICQTLWANPAIRDATVAAATDHVKRSTTRPLAAEKPGQDAVAGSAAGATPTQPSTAPGGLGETVNPAPTTFPSKQITEMAQQMNGLNVGVGWDGPWTAQAKLPWLDWFPWWGKKLLGLLFTTAAVSLGAPFWFDTLNRFINFRSSIKTDDATANKAVRRKTAPPATSEGTEGGGQAR